MSIPNAARVCARCSEPTPNVWARYCDRCEAWFDRQDDLEARATWGDLDEEGGDDDATA